MKYQPPYGMEATPDAPYINGNPATGTMGSIPPAASIEHPQREITNLIKDVGYTPADTDLRQLSKGIQGGKLFYSVDQGVPNLIAITPTPPVATLIAGMFFNVKVAATNAGPTVLQVSGLGGVEVVHADYSPLAPNELIAGGIACFFYDGLKFQLVWSQRIGVGEGMPVFLTRNMDYYVNGTSGLDTYDGLAATVGGGHGPFQTIQRACNEVSTFNLNGFTVKVHVANGNYSFFGAGTLAGSGACMLIGDVTNPANVNVTRSTGDASASTALISGPNYLICGMKVSGVGSGLVAVGGGISSYYNMQFGACGGAHIQVHSGANLSMSSYDMNGSLGTFKIVDGNATGGHIYVTQASAHTITAGGGPQLQIIQPINVGPAWAQAHSQSLSSEVYSSILGAGNVSGPKFWATGLSLINTQGAGVNYLPGNSAGSTASGAEYT